MAPLPRVLAAAAALAAVLCAAPAHAIYCGARDCYDVLGVQPTATPADVRSAYRELARTHHPDKSDDPRSAELFVEIAAAYEIIGDQESRRGERVSE